MTPLALAAMVCLPSEPALSRAIERTSWAPKAERAARATALAKRILIEARRFRLDPLALAAVGSVESDFRPRAKGPGAKPRGFGRRIYEFGTFQLIPQSGPVRAAARLLDRCSSPPKSPVRSARLLACSADVVRARRGRTGPLTRAELEDYTIGTWVAALEIRMFLDGCALRHARGHRPIWRWRWYQRAYAKRYGLPAAVVARLERYALQRGRDDAPTTLRAPPGRAIQPAVAPCLQGS